MPVYRVCIVGSPYVTADLSDIDFAQTADVVYLAHLNHLPTKLIRHSHTSWEFVEVSFAPLLAAPGSLAVVPTTPNTDAANAGNAYFPQPATYVVTAFNETTGQESRPSTAETADNDLSLKRNYNTLTWAAVTGATAYRIYKGDNQQAYGNIGSTDQLTFRDDNIGPDLSTGIPVADSPFSATASDRPSAVQFHEQRSWWGCTINKPNGLWASRSADYENMDYSRPGREDDSILVGLVADKVNSIRNLVSSEQGLLALTSNNIFAIQGSNEDYITATPPPRSRPKVRRGASNLKPIAVDSIIFYETARGGDMRTLGYSFEIDGLRTDDLTVFSRHLFEGHRIVSWGYAEKPSSCFYVVLEDGRCLCLTWDQAQQVWGWTELETDGQFLRVCVIYEQAEDRVYFVVKRTISGSAKYYIERLATELWTDEEDACYLDSAKSYVNATTATRNYNRLEHLEGKTVYAWVDGAVVKTGADGNPLVVSNGLLTLPQGGLKVSIGLPFTAEVETLPLAIQTGSGWNVAKPQQVSKALLRVVNTRNVLAGITKDDLFEIKQRDLEAYGSPEALYTGDLDVEIAGSNGDQTSIFVRSSDPVPFDLSAVLLEPKFGDMV